MEKFIKLILEDNSEVLLNNENFEGVDKKKIKEIETKGAVEFKDFEFENCSVLEVVKLGEGVEKLPHGIFWNCANLTSFSLPKTLNATGNAIVAHCVNLKTISVDGGNKAFKIADCGLIHVKARVLVAGFNKNSIEIKDDILEISNHCFAGMSDIKKVFINKSVERIGSGAFACCFGVEEFKVEKGSKNFSSACNCITEKKTKKIICANKNTKIPSGTKVIGDACFMELDIEKIDIPNSVVSIMTSAFQGCNSLADVSFGKSVETIGINAFNGCKNLKTVNFSEGLKRIEGYAFRGCESLIDISVPASCLNIADGTFMNCIKLETAKIKGDLKVYQSSLFENCLHLKSVNTPKSLMIIGGSVFANCQRLGSFEFNEGLKNIGAKAFSFTALKSVVIPNSTLVIDECAFFGCEKLESTKITRDTRYVNHNAFTNCDNNEILVEGDSIKPSWASFENYNYKFI